LDAVSYLRRSGAVAPGANDISFPTQQSAVTSLAARFGDSIGTEFSDHAKSGGSTKGREGYLNMLAAIEAGQVKSIYAYAFTRLTRSQRDAIVLFDLCKKHGVPIRTADGVDTATMAGGMIADLMALVAQWERQWAIERNQRAAQTRRERGMASGRQVYGTQPGEDPEVVRDALKQAGTFAGAARRLNEQGVPTRLGRANGWTHATVAGIIRHHYTQKRQGAAPIGGALFSGLLTCHCGTTLTPSRREGKVRGMYCRNSYAIENHGKTFVTDAAIRPWAEAESAKYQPQGIAIRGSNDKERRDLEGRKERLNDMYAAGGMPKSEYLSRLAVITTRLAELDKADSTLQALVPMPIGIDWSKPDDAINDQLRRVWKSVDLDRDMKPVSVSWKVPDWLWDEKARDAYTAQQDADVAAAQKAGA
jgi:DNA invertase Pin-like site-specific DNA recombinase